MVLGLERNLLHMRALAVQAEILDVLESDDAGSVPDREVLQRSVESLVDMQVGFAAKRAGAISRKRQRSVHAQGSATIRKELAGGIRVVEACQR